MRALITGAEGQDGHFLSWELRGRGHDVVMTALYPAPDDGHHGLDVTDAAAVEALIVEMMPDVVFHLAAVSSVTYAEQNPELAHAVNVGGVANVLTALARFAPACLFVNASSVEVYAPATAPLVEESPLGGSNAYARTKQKALELVRAARRAGAPATNAILSNHESALRGPQFVMGKIGRGVAAVVRGDQPNVVLGNLDVERDWSYAGDICHGMVRIAELGYVGDVILASGSTVRLEDVVRVAFAAGGIADWQAHVTTDAALVRSEGLVRRLDVTRARTELNWQATTPLETWVGDIVRAFL